MTESSPEHEPTADTASTAPVDEGGPVDGPGTEVHEDVPAPPETGDLVIDAALGDLAAAPTDDLDAQLASGEAVQRTLQSRLSDLGG